MSLSSYAKYKPSGIDWLSAIPSHWSTCALKRLVCLKSGESITSDQIFEAGEFAVYGGNGLRGFTSSFTHEGRYALVGRQGALCGNVNYSEGKFWASEHAVVATPIKPLATNYLGELLRTMNLNQYSVSAAQPGLSVELISNIGVPYPSLDEQNAIAAFLDHETAKIDALIAEQEKLIALLAEKRQATISHAVTRGLNPDVPMKDSGVAWLGEVPAHWVVGPLKRFWSVTDCKHITADFVEDGFALASIREVQSRFVQLENAKKTTDIYYYQLIDGGRKPTPGDLIFSRNATVGEVAQVPNDHPPFAMGQDVCLLRKINKKYSSDFLQETLRSGPIIEQIKNIMVGSTFKRVNVEEIRGLYILMPPAIEQVEIAQFLVTEAMKLSTLSAQSERAIDLLKERRSALIAAAVTGQIDVRNFMAEAS